MCSSFPNSFPLFFFQAHFFYNSFLPKCLFHFGPLSHTFNLNTSLLFHGPPMLWFFFPPKNPFFSYAEKPMETWPLLIFSKHPFFSTLSFSKIALLSYAVYRFPCSPSFFFFPISSLFLCLSIASTTSNAAPLGFHWKFQGCDESSNRRKKRMGPIPIRRR